MSGVAIITLMFFMISSVVAVFSFKEKYDTRKDKLSKKGSTKISEDPMLRLYGFIYFTSLFVLVITVVILISTSMKALTQDSAPPVDIIESSEIQVEEVPQPQFLSNTLQLEEKQAELDSKQKLQAKIYKIDYSIDKLKNKIKESRLIKEISFFPSLDDEEMIGQLYINNLFIEAKVDLYKDELMLKKPNLLDAKYEPLNRIIKTSVLKSENFTKNDLKTLIESYFSKEGVVVYIIMFKLKDS